jgi:[acyl-carrier-protein] S-malonyltransferase
MQPAVQPFKMALRKVEINDPIIDVYSNVDGKNYKNAHHIRMQLPKQIYRSVKWEQTLHILYERKIGEHFPRTFECGPGHSLKTLLKMVNAKAWDSCFSIQA